MNRLVYKYRFTRRVPMNDVEDSLFMAALAAEALHGRAAMKLDAYFRLDKKTRICVVDAETQVGCDIAKMLSTFISKGYGDSAFRVMRMEEQPENRGLLRALGVLI